MEYSIFDLKIRNDSWGKGHFGARRGLRMHKGVDLVIDSSLSIKSPIDGVITKFGIVYKDPKKSQFRYVEITHFSGYRVRLHYVGQLTKRVYSLVKKDESIGIVQDVAGFYNERNPEREPMINHVHFEGFDLKNKRINPMVFLALGK